MEIREYLRDNILLFDGAMGTYYAARNPGADRSCEWANLTAPEEVETIDLYKADFESMVPEQERLWLRDGGITDDSWESYKEMLSDSCGMDELLQVYQDAYDRYAAAQAE